MPPAFALSQDQTLRFIFTPVTTNKGPNQRKSEQIPANHPGPVLPPARTVPSGTSTRNAEQPHKRLCNAFKRRYITDTPMPINPDDQTKSRQSKPSGYQIQSTTRAVDHMGAANVSLPSFCNCQRTSGKTGPLQDQPAVAGGGLIKPPDQKSTPFFENFERAVKVSDETKPVVVQYTLIQLLQVEIQGFIKAQTVNPASATRCFGAASASARRRHRRHATPGQALKHSTGHIFLSIFARPRSA
jgi:hypothetical protein